MEAKLFGLGQKQLEDAATEYRQVFPFSDFDPTILRSYLETIESSETLKYYFRHIGTPCHYYDSLVLVLNILKEKYIKGNEKFYYFMDCLSNGGAACNLAYINGIHRCLSIELSNASKTRSIDAQNHILELYPPTVPSSPINYKVGSMQDYFDFEANIVFLSTIEVSFNPLVDEARLLLTFLRMTRRLEVSSFVIIMTRRMGMHLFVATEVDRINNSAGQRADNEMMKFNHLRQIFGREEGDHNVYLFEVVAVTTGDAKRKK